MLPGNTMLSGKLDDWRLWQRACLDMTLESIRRRPAHHKLWVQDAELQALDLPDWRRAVWDGVHPRWRGGDASSLSSSHATKVAKQVAFACTESDLASQP